MIQAFLWSFGNCINFDWVLFHDSLHIKQDIWNLLKASYFMRKDRCKCFLKFIWYWLLNSLHFGLRVVFHNYSCLKIGKLISHWFLGKGGVKWRLSHSGLLIKWEREVFRQYRANIFSGFFWGFLWFWGIWGLELKKRFKYDGRRVKMNWFIFLWKHLLIS